MTAGAAMTCRRPRTSSNLVGVPASLPSRRVLAATAVAVVGVGAGGYLAGREAGTDDPGAATVPPLRTAPTRSAPPEVILPGRTPVPRRVRP